MLYNDIDNDAIMLPTLPLFPLVPNGRTAIGCVQQASEAGG